MKVIDIVRPELEKIAKLVDGSVSIYMDYSAGYVHRKHNVGRAHLIVGAGLPLLDFVVEGGFEEAIAEFYRLYAPYHENEILFRNFRAIA